MSPIKNTPTRSITYIAAIVFSSCLSQSVHATCSPVSDVYMGSICTTAASFCPRGYMQAAGQLLPISQYQALYSLLGSAYGGDNRTVVGLPDLRGRSIVGSGESPGLTQVNVGQKRGVETVTQSIAQMPAHNHTATVTGGSGEIDVTLSAIQASGQNTPQEGYLLGSGGGGPSAASIYVPPATPGTAVNLGGVNVTGSGSDPVSVAIGNTGNGGAMINIPPQLGMLTCIATEGLYPPRP